MISHQLINQIDQLRETFATAKEKTLVSISAKSDTVRVGARLVDCDRLGCLLDNVTAEQIAIDREDWTEINPVQIEGVTDMLLDWVTYLTEELTLVEKAADFSRISFRSAQPDKRGDGIYYYELTLDAGQVIHLDRWCYSFETPRTP